MDDLGNGCLTQAQVCFADTHRASPGGPSPIFDGSVFFYRSDDDRQERWLVGRDGDILDIAWFHSRA
jgi:hypothetical protein